MVEREVPYFLEFQSPTKPDIEKVSLISFGRIAVHTHVKLTTIISQ